MTESNEKEPTLDELRSLASQIAPESFELDELRLADSVESVPADSEDTDEVSDDDTGAGEMTPEWQAGKVVDSPPLDEG